MSNRGSVLERIGIGQPIDFDQFQRGQQIALERDRLRAYQQQQQQDAADRKGREAADKAYKNLAFLQEATNTGDIKTGPERIRSFAINKLNEIKKKYSGQIGTMDISELAPAVINEVTPIVNFYQSAMKKTAEEQDKVNAAVAKNPNLNKEKLLNDVYANIVNDYLDIDEQGEFKPKPIDMVNTSTDYTGNLLSSQDYHKYALGTKPLTDYFDKVKGVPVSVFVAKGPQSRTKWTGQMTDFQELDQEPDEYGFVKNKPNFKFKTETSNGVEMLPKDLFDTHIYDSPDKQIAFDNSWDAFKKAHNLKFSDRDAEDKGRRTFALNELVKPHIRNVMSSEVFNEPPAPRVTVNAGGGQSGLNINDVYQEIDDALRAMEDKGSNWLPVKALNPDAKKVIIEDAAKSRKDKEYVDTDLKIIRGDDGTLRVWDKDGEFVNFVGKKSTNLKVQPGVKEKRAVVEEGNDVSKKHNIGQYEYNGATGTYEQLVEAFGKEATDKAIKEGIIKKK